MKNTKSMAFIFRFKFKAVFWLTLAILLLFAVTPRGYAQSVDSGSSTNANGTTTDIVGTSTDSGTTTPPQAVEPAPVTQPVPAPVPAVTTPVVGPQDPAPVSFPYKKKFTVSSYYSPLPGQSYYFTGSYESDVRLNGEGVHMADGSVVFPGAAAAPKTYPFGTKMFIPGFGIVAIHDRGGAIKNNRLDIWVGSGEEGLRRALGWGMRTLEVTVYGIDPSIQESVNFTDVPMANLVSILPRTKYFKSDLGDGDNGPAVAELQRFLKRLGYFSGDVTGFFGDETKQAVQKFQLEKKVIADTFDTGAGNFGPKTRVALEDLLDGEKNTALAKIPEGVLAKGSGGEAVKNLQEFLVEYGTLNSVTGSFDADTVDALARFQLDYGVIDNANDKAAGYYGPKTKTAVEKVISERYEPQIINSPAAIHDNTSQDAASEAQISAVFTKSLALNDKGPEVKMLQEELARLQFIGVEPTGFYGKVTEHAIFKFQQAFGISQTEKDFGAGVLGPKTLDKLNEIAIARLKQQKVIADTVENNGIVAQRLESERVLVASVIEAEKFASDIGYGTRGKDVENLQKVLKRLGFFQGRLTTEYYGDITKGAIIAFQKSHSIDATGALDTQTRRILNKIILPS
ncbi:peptidoglycan-binding protein [Candidatus Peregrinibacteria bacterium]|nr:peptidoglycan-binding protein [Candidatus Peregrinibacteria bacterium]